MERPTILEHLAALIGQTYTAEDHAAVVAHLAAVERLAQDVIALRGRERAARVVRTVRPVFHSDPEAAEI